MPVKFNLMFPMRATKHYPRWIGDGDLGAVARVVEDAGFDGFSMSEHPYPDRKWLANGGHHAFDPFVALSIAAQATSKINLVTYLMVLGYRNPYLGAKSAASLDLLSGGRLILGLGAGYLASEFEALGVDYRRRGALLDEGIDAMRAAWRGDEHTGPEFGVEGHIALPGPTTPDGPPIWIGGNSRAARRRVVQKCDGWMPIAQSGEMAAITRTPPLETVSELAEHVEEISKRRAEWGRGGLDVSFVPFESEKLRTDGVEQFVDDVGPRLADYEAAGVTWITIEPTSRSYADFCRDIEYLGDRLLRVERR